MVVNTTFDSFSLAVANPSVGCVSMRAVPRLMGGMRPERAGWVIKGKGLRVMTNEVARVCGGSKIMPPHLRALALLVFPPRPVPNYSLKGLRVICRGAIGVSPLK